MLRKKVGVAGQQKWWFGKGQGNVIATMNMSVKGGV
jgi:hypothetical protein